MESYMLDAGLGWLGLLQLEHRSSSGPLGVVLSNKMLTSSFQIGGVLGGELGLGGAGLGGAGLGGLEVLDLEVSLDLEVVSIKVSDWSDAGLGGELGGGRLEHKRRARN